MKKASPNTLILEMNPSPFYIDIAEQLRKQITGKRFRHGQRFPTIRQLTRKTQKSPTTVRKALQLLEKEGLLEARHGSGYYVKKALRPKNNITQKNILAILPQFTNPGESWFTGKIFEGMMVSGAGKNLKISFCQLSDDDKNHTEKSLFDKVCADMPDGLVWFHAKASDRNILTKLKGLNIPIITTMRKLQGMGVPVVKDDDIAFGFLVMSALKTHGHSNIGVICGNPEDNYYRHRISALCQAGISLGININSNDIIDLGNVENAEEGVNLLSGFLEKNRDLTALVILHSYSIHYVVKLLFSPRPDIIQSKSIVYNVLDGVPVPSMPNKLELTTVTPPLKQMGEEIIRKLLSMIDGSPDFTSTPLIPELKAGITLKQARH